MKYFDRLVLYGLSAIVFKLVVQTKTWWVMLLPVIFVVTDMIEDYKQRKRIK